MASAHANRPGCSRKRYQEKNAVNDDASRMAALAK
jgi:hypothetical protein